MIAIGITIGTTTTSGGSAPVDDWILATGSWNDSGFWRDDKNWID
jgi:hypothetical protein